MEHNEQREYSIGELAGEAGVSSRTIRYYVSEGLLPPPVGAGPNSRYTETHRRQLEIIGRLKAQYLPLKEIRRRLIGHGSLPMARAATNAPTADSGPPPVRPMSRRFREIAEDRLAHFIRAEDQATPPPGEPMYMELNASMPPPPASPDRDQPWRRVAISDEAELLITEDQYRRNQDKIDWLVQWAQKVLKS